jgi:molybdopterin molybdotransferase
MLLVRPAMDILAGGEARALLKLPVKASFSYKKRKGRTEFLRGRLEIGADGQPELHIHGRKGAGVISSLLGADGLIEIPREAEHIEAGEMLNFIPFAEGGL